MAITIPQGYTAVVPLTITNQSATQALGGSTTVPVPSSSTDYVVVAQLTGTAASAVYTGAADQSAFGDVTVWWIDDGDAVHQLDLHQDQVSNGAWSASNVTLRFRLQAPIAAAGLCIARYVVAYGNVAPAVLSDWANIYPLADRFVGSTLDTARWIKRTDGSYTVTVSDGLALTAGIGGGSGVVDIQSRTSFGVQYMAEFYGSVANVTGSSQNELRFANGFAAPAARLDANGAGSSSSPGNAVVVAQSTSASHSTTLLSPVDYNAHLWRLGRDVSGIPTGYIDAHTATDATYPRTETLAVTLNAYYGGAMGAGTSGISAQWLVVRPWLGQGLEPTVSAGAPVTKSGIALCSSTSPGPLVRSGGRGLARSDPSTWLLLYSDGTSALARSGASAAALAAATPQSVAGSASGVAGAALIAGGTDGTASALLADTSSGTPADVERYASGAWSAGTATGLPAGAVFAGTLYTASSSFWHAVSATAGGTILRHFVATAQGGPFSALSTASTAALPSADPPLCAEAYAGTLVAATISAAGTLHYATLDTLSATSGGSAGSASTLATTHGALAPQENLALLCGLANGAGDLVLAYNNNLGLCVRASAAGGPLSWSSETQVTSGATDSCPTLVRDETGALTLFWIAGSAGNPIRSQRLQVVGGTLYLTGSALTRTNYGATRSLLGCAPSEPSGTVGLVWLES